MPNSIQAGQHLAQFETNLDRLGARLSDPGRPLIAHLVRSQPERASLLVELYSAYCERLPDTGPIDETKLPHTRFARDERDRLDACVVFTCPQTGQSHVCRLRTRVRDEYPFEAMEAMNNLEKLAQDYEAASRTPPAQVFPSSGNSRAWLQAQFQAAAGGPSANPAAAGVLAVESGAVRQAARALPPIAPLDEGRMRRCVQAFRQEMQRWSEGKSLDGAGKKRLENTFDVIDKMLDPAESYEDFRILGNFDGEKLAGVMLLKTAEREPPFIRFLVTHPDYPGNGKKYIQHAETISEDVGQNGNLHLAPLNDLSIEIFKKLGFKKGLDTPDETSDEDSPVSAAHRGPQYEYMHRYPSESGSE
jgi:hypothetical protein